MAGMSTRWVLGWSGRRRGGDDFVAVRGQRLAHRADVLGRDAEGGQGRHEVPDDAVEVLRRDVQAVVGSGEVAAGGHGRTTGDLDEQRALVGAQGAQIDVLEVVRQLRIADDPLVEIVDRGPDSLLLTESFEDRHHLLAFSPVMSVSRTTLSWRP